MSLPTPLEMMGAPGSPYTRKMRALLRYRDIPYRLILNGSREQAGKPMAKVQLMPTFYLPNESGEIVPTTDSTPLIRRFEATFDGRSVIPPDPVVAFIDALLEDYADEWLTKPMFHYRWAYQADIDKACGILPLWSNVSMPQEAHDKFSKMIGERQIGRLGVVGSNQTTAPVIEASYRRFLQLMDRHLAAKPYLMGERPGASDFATYGQLTCLVGFDPTPAAIALEESFRTCACTEKLEDLSGLEPLESDWITRDAIPPTIMDLLREVGRVYAPYLVANAAAVEAGDAELSTTIDGKPWVQKPFPYQRKCKLALRDARIALSDADRAALDAILSGTGCEVLFEDA
jgi:glutathione S-transferase